MASLALFPILILLMIIAYKLYNKLRFTLPPGPYPMPIVGNLFAITPVKFRCFSEWSKVYGPIMSVWFGSHLHVVVSSPELAKQVLKDHDEKLADRHRNWIFSLISRDGVGIVWADYNPHYTKLRNLCMLELFSAKSLEMYRHIREDEVRIMVKSLFRDLTSGSDNAGGFVIRKYVGAMAFNNITRLLFGKRYENEEGVLTQEGKEFVRNVTMPAESGSVLEIVQEIWWLTWLLVPHRLGVAKMRAEEDAMQRALLMEGNAGKSEEKHFLGALLSLREKYDLTQDDIGGLLWGQVSAGLDTVAISAEWTMAELTRNPRVLQKVVEELDRVVGPGLLMMEADISNLPYLKCIAKESLRLHPPTPLMLPHKAKANVKIGGYDIPKGTAVHVNVWAIGRDKRTWQDPESFRPERFMEMEHDFGYLPFGAGKRMCPAAQLGTNMVILMVGNLVHSFDWSLPEGVTPKEIDMSESPGLVSYMKTPLAAVPKLTLQQGCSALNKSDVILESSHLGKSIKKSMSGREIKHKNTM